MNTEKRLKREFKKTFKMLSVIEVRIKCHMADMELDYPEHYKNKRAERLLKEFKNSIYKLNDLLNVDDLLSDIERSEKLAGIE